MDAAPNHNQPPEAARVSGTDAPDQLWRQMVANAADAMALVDQSGRIALVNPALEVMFGYAAGELTGQAIEVLIPESVRGRHLGHRNGYFASPRPRAMGAGHDLAARRRDGSAFPVAISLSPLRTSEGLLALATISDITGRKKAEEALRTSEKRWRELVEHAADAMLMVTHDGRIILANPKAREMFGYGEAELVGQAVEMLIPERARGRHLEHRQGFYASPRPRSMGEGLDLAGRRSDGSEFPVRVSLGPVETDEGLVVLATISDITEARRASEALRTLNEELKTYATELERSNADLQQFAYVSSHDLKEPLRMVSSYLKLIERRYAERLDDDGREFIGFAVDGAARMENLINDLLAYSRVGTRGQPFATTDIEDVLAQALNNLQIAIEESGARVTHDPLPSLPADATQLIALFQNLIGNGVKFHTEGQPLVHIRAERDGEEWRFSVRDNGIGIEPEYHERIFVIFQRLHGRNDYPGTGIGLAVCKRIVERHNGRIWVESRVGGGSTFFFTLPAIQKG